MDQHWEKKREWIIERIGGREYDALVLRSNGTRQDYAAIRLLLRREIARMTGRA